jgi:hypothetical protein
MTPPLPFLLLLLLLLLVVVVFSSTSINNLSSENEDLRYQVKVMGVRYMLGMKDVAFRRWSAHAEKDHANELRRAHEQEVFSIYVYIYIYIIYIYI